MESKLPVAVEESAALEEAVSPVEAVLGLGAKAPGGSVRLSFRCFAAFPKSWTLVCLLETAVVLGLWRGFFTWGWSPGRLLLVGSLLATGGLLHAAAVLRLLIREEPLTFPRWRQGLPGWGGSLLILTGMAVLLGGLLLATGIPLWIRVLAGVFLGSMTLDAALFLTFFRAPPGRSAILAVRALWGEGGAEVRGSLRDVVVDTLMLVPLVAFLGLGVALQGLSLVLVVWPVAVVNLELLRYLVAMLAKEQMFHRLGVLSPRSLPEEPGTEVQAEGPPGED